MEPTKTEFGLTILELDGTVHREIAGWSCMHMTTARREAREQAAKWGLPVRIDRVTNGKRKPTLVIGSDGTPTRPAGSVGTPRGDCKKGSGGACFCVACRADRRTRSAS